MGARTNMSSLALRRRNLIIAACALMVIFVVTYSQPFVDVGEVKNIVPGHSEALDSPILTTPNGYDDKAADGTNYVSSETPEYSDPNEFEDEFEEEPTDDLGFALGGKPEDPVDGELGPGSDIDPENKPAEDLATDIPSDQFPGEGPGQGNGQGTGDVMPDIMPVPPMSNKTSNLHFLIQATGPNLHFCVNMLSSIVNRYSPIVLGWNATGEFDAKSTHLAKLRTLYRYLGDLEPEKDDDLVVMVDGYDVIMQLPAEIMIERYYEIAHKADVRLAKRFGITVEEMHSRGIRQSIFWGPDKVCWPSNDQLPRCWAVPDSGLGPNAFGPMSGSGDFFFGDPRYLNSGTLIGPVDDIRNMTAAVLDMIDETFNPEFWLRDSDQLYVSNLWARQEYFRSVTAAAGSEVEGGPEDRIVPTRKEGEKTEFHVSLEYESSLFQTRAFYDRFYGYLEYSKSGLNAEMNRDIFELGPDFRPYDIQMPPNVVASLVRLYDDIPEAHPGTRGSDWIRLARLGTNFVTRHIYALWHCTGDKDSVKFEVKNMWYFEYATALMKAAVKASRTERLMTRARIDGRKWATGTVYPDPNDAVGDELGGAWTDYNGTSFVPWADMCGRYNYYFFDGEEWRGD